MDTITVIKQKYKDHPIIENIESALDQALMQNSAIPEYCLKINGMSGIIYRHFINNFMNSIEDPRYLEVGSFQGSTLCAAIGGIENMYALAIDNFSYPDSNINIIRDNVEKTKGVNSNITVLDQDFNTFDLTKCGQFNVYMFDGDHSEEDHRLAITRIVPALEEISLIIIDDWNNHQGVISHIKTGTYQGFKESGLEILYKFEVETNVNPPFPSPWHNGYGVFLVQKHL